VTSMLLVAIDGEQFAVVALIIVTLTYFFHKKGSLDYKGMLLADFFGIIAFALGGLSAFIALGRLRVMRPTRPRVSTTMFSYAMEISSSKLRVDRNGFGWRRPQFHRFSFLR